jgi:hypothetical protein
VTSQPKEDGLPETECYHTFMNTFVTAYSDDCGTIKHSQVTAAHLSARTTCLYGRTGDETTLDEVERESESHARTQILFVRLHHGR